MNHLAKHVFGGAFHVGGRDSDVYLFILMDLMFSCYSMDPSDLAY